jgi:hypothetical protein
VHKNTVLLLDFPGAENRILPAWHITRRFIFHDKTFPYVPEIHPVQDQVCDYQGSKYQGRVIMHIQPLASWNVQVQ